MSNTSRLEASGWRRSVRVALERLINDGANQRLPAVFDFDNTLVCGDIGEATLAVLARAQVLTPRTVPASISLPFRAGGRRLVRIEKCSDVTEYYEALLDPTVHGSKDRQPLANGYAWATQVMEGLRVADVVAATRRAFEWSDVANPGKIEVTPGRTAYPVPFFYPEMIELVGELIRHRFDVWIVSASNAWSVRWMALNVLNPLLRRRGISGGIRPENVVGISMVLADRANRFYKDTVLVRENEAYARLDRSALGRFRLTAHLQYPVPTYSGKIAVINDLIGKAPYLVAGDSPGDLPMMSIARHRLWIARQNKAGYQKTAAEWFSKTGGTWLVQPAMTDPGSGFVV